MTTDYLERLATFLSRYVQPHEGGLVPPKKEYIADAIRVLVEEKIFTIEELRQKAGKEYDVIIPDFLLYGGLEK